MFIHWFPGHMAKAMRMMSDEVKLVDNIVYVLDARAPLSCINPHFDGIIAGKPVLYIINKCDLVEKCDAEAWHNYFLSKGERCILTNCLSKADAPQIVKNLQEMNEATIQKYLNKGVKKTLRAMVIGVPNTGKSTLINSLIKEKKAATGNRPGVTKGKQWVSIDKYIDLLDSPGVLYPDFEDQDKATRLAIIGSIKDDILDVSELALEVVTFFMQEYPAKLQARYAIGDFVGKKPLDVMEDIAASRKFLLRGGDFDYERTAKAIITDFRKATFGKVILERAK